MCTGPWLSPSAGSQPCLVPGRVCPAEAQRGWSQPASGHGLGDVFSWTDLWQIPDSIASPTTAAHPPWNWRCWLSQNTKENRHWCVILPLHRLVPAVFPTISPSALPLALCPLPLPATLRHVFCLHTSVHLVSLRCPLFHACLAHPARALGPGWNATSSGGLPNPRTCTDSLTSSLVQLVITHGSSCPAPACWLGRCATRTDCKV